MMEIDPDNLHIALGSLLASLGSGLTSDGGALAPDKIDRTARAVSSCLKTLNDISAFNEKAKALRDKESCTAYEDLPPPSSADRDRILRGLMGRYDRVHDAGAGKPLP